MNGQRNIYLKMKSLAEARALIETGLPVKKLEAEAVSVIEAVGRVLAGPVFAAISSPGFHAAAMDGVAVAAESTFGASETAPKILAVGGQAHFVNTGNTLPEGTNAVIMIEMIHMADDAHIEIDAPAFPWQHVRRTGEDIVATELVFARHEAVTPYAVGALLSAGIREVSVLKRPKIFILPTGRELVDPRHTAPERMKPGQVIDSNSHMLARMVRACGGESVVHDIVTDDPEMISAAIKKGAGGDYDLILLVGGSSAGTEDFTRRVIADLGRVLIHGVTMMPGKPVIAGEIGGLPVFGIPGYAVSAIIAFEQLVRPLLLSMLHQREPEMPAVQATPTQKIASRLGMEEFVRVKLGRVGDRMVATPLPRGAGSISSITEADGIIRIPNHVEGIPEDRPVTANLLRPLSEISDTIVAVGSHDNTIDILADLIRARSSRVRLSSSHVGSMGGLIAVKKGVCHAAGTHLLDTTDGSYNISYIKRYLPGTPVRLVHLVKRDQGLIVAPGNPKNIRAIDDLTRPEVTFINRQMGSGTRILLDYRLAEQEISREQITGYETEEFTHMAVAAAVLSGAADAGLGIHAAAKALGLEFIPVMTESYELVIPEPFIDTPKIRLLLDIIGSDEFKQEACRLGGYHTDQTGTLIWKSA